MLQAGETLPALMSHYKACYIMLLRAGMQFGVGMH